MKRDYEFKTHPFDHQQDEWAVSRQDPARAIFWEQGTGKSKLIIDTAAWLWLTGQIDGVCIVAPNGVHRNWVEEEIPNHLPDSVMADSLVFQYQTERAPTKWHAKAVKTVLEYPKLAWMAVSYDAFMTKAGKKALINFFDKRKLLYVLDEGHFIKTPGSSRTKSILKSAKYAPFKRLLTGTPIATGPFDVWSEIKFLDDKFWDQHGLSTFAEFKTHFGVFGRVFNPHLKRQFNPKNNRWEECDGGFVKVLKTYRRLDELRTMLEPIASRVTKDVVLDLPPKLYQKKWTVLNPEQKKMYAELRDEYLTWIGTEAPGPDELEPVPAGACETCGGQRELEMEGFIYQCPDCLDLGPTGHVGQQPIFAAMAITRLLRLQQVICGYIPTDNEEEPIYVIPGPNHRLDDACDLIEQSPSKVIVWARFRMDIDLILAELKRRGIAAVRYDGEVGTDDRAEAKARFQGVRAVYEGGMLVGREKVPEEEQAKVFVGNPAAGGMGLTLTAAKMVIYYSNSFKLIERLQSEDRPHRIGQENPVLYVDMMAEDTVDDKIVEGLKTSFNIARQITGDTIKEWI